MKLRSRVSLIALSFLFALGSGVAVAGASQSCLNACNAEQTACLADATGMGKTACVNDYKACKKACGA